MMTADQTSSSAGSLETSTSSASALNMSPGLPSFLSSIFRPVVGDLSSCEKIECKFLGNAPFSPRTDHKTCLLSDYALLIIGGEKKHQSDGPILKNDIYKWMPSSNEWSCLKENSDDGELGLNETPHSVVQKSFSGRNSVSCFVYNDRLYIWGGVGRQTLRPDLCISSKLSQYKCYSSCNMNDGTKNGLQENDSVARVDDAMSDHTQEDEIMDFERFSDEEQQTTTFVHNDFSLPDSDRDQLDLSFKIWDLCKVENSPIASDRDMEGFFGNAHALWNDGTKTYWVTIFGNTQLRTDDDLQSGKLKSVYACDLSTMKWETWYTCTEPLHIRGHKNGEPNPRYVPLYCQYGDYMYMLGGRESQTNTYVFKDLFRFSFITKKWELLYQVVPIRLSRNYKTIQSVLVDDIWYIVSYGKPAVLYRYYMRGNFFDFAGKIPDFPLQGRYSLDYFPSRPGRIYAMGGYILNDKVPVNDVYEIILPNAKCDVEMIKNNLSNLKGFTDVCVTTLN